MSCDFETTTYGKWILAGEHAVVRGHEALVFPVKEKQLVLRYKPGAPQITTEYSGADGEIMQVLFRSVLEHGLQILGRSITHSGGHFSLCCNLPVGAGMGASAALCVAVSRWFCAQELLADERCMEFARELEHLFHGKSSGVDIAGVAAEGGVYFKAGNCIPLQPVMQPIWYLSSCNQISITSHCIKQVQTLWESNPVTAENIDQQMATSVQEARHALEFGGETALQHLAQAINKASNCFFQWGLVSESLQQHMQNLLAQGALAVKPTGSGSGGFVLSLWERVPDNAEKMIAV